MARKKHLKIIEVNTFPNVFNILENPKLKEFTDYFNNTNPIVLEIGCGHGDYTINLAKHFPEKNFIGVDVKGARIFKGASSVLESKTPNAAFLVGRIERLTEVFINSSVSEILIPFPDPHVRRKSERKRLVSERFLNIYNEVLTKQGRIHFKTDNEMLYEFALETISRLNLKLYYKSDDLKLDDETDVYRSLQTYYEGYYRREGRIIKYICFGF